MNINSTLDAPEEETSPPSSPLPPPPPAENGSTNVPTVVIRTSRAGKKREALALEKLDSLKHLIRTIDILVYTELFILYYMDCSFFRLIIRALAQLVLFSPIGPRSSPLTVDRPYISGIFIPNTLCLILHTFTSRPEANESMRGYLHGGIIMDLIGQKGPTSKLHLLLLDLFILFLQCFLLSVNTRYKELHFYVKNKEYRKPSGTMGVIAEETLSEMATGGATQNYDAEERGVLRMAGTSSEDIELQDIPPLTPNPRGTFSSSNLEANSLGNSFDHSPLLHTGSTTENLNLLSDALLTTPSPSAPTPALTEYLDHHHSAIAITAEFHILHCLKLQYRMNKMRGEMLGGAARAFGEGRERRLASVGDILARAMEGEGTTGTGTGREG